MWNAIHKQFHWELNMTGRDKLSDPPFSLFQENTIEKKRPCAHDCVQRNMTTLLEHFL